MITSRVIYPLSFQEIVMAKRYSLLLFLMAVLLGESLAMQAPSTDPLVLDPEKALSQYIHEVWQVDDGLPQNSVQALIQTHDGYIWLGTQEGLARFDGLTFTTFDKRNTEAMGASHDVRVLYEDAGGTLWIGTYGGGLVRYKDGHFVPVALQEGLTGQYVSALVEGRDGKLWVGTTDAGLFVFDHGRFQPVSYFNVNFVRALAIDTEENLWVGADNGLYRIQGKEIRRFTVADGLPDDFVMSLRVDTDGGVWVGTRQGLNYYKDGQFQLAHVAEEGVAVRVIYQDQSGSLWFGLEQDGLVRNSAGRMSYYSAEDGLSNNRVVSLLQDREGSLWIGTEGGGLNRLRNGKFTNYGRLEGLAADMAYAVYEDQDGSLWIGTDGGGLNRMQDGKMTTYTTRDGLPSNVVVSVFGDRPGRLWIGTLGGGLARLEDGVFSTYSTDQGLVSNGVFALATGADESLWVGTDAGLSHLEGRQFTNYTTQDGLTSDFITVIHEDRHGALWIGTYDGGLNRLQDGQWTAYTTAEGLGSDVILSIYEDTKGVLWIGTYGGGLSRLKEGVLNTFTAQQGLFDDVVYQILEDEEEHLWMSCNRGIYRVSKKELEAVAQRLQDQVESVAYTKADGLRSYEMNGGFQPAGWKGKDGVMWFPTMKGVAGIDPSHLQRNPVAPPVVIESILVDKKPLDQMRDVELSPGKDKVEFNFTALSYIAPERIHFRYKLEGYDPDWNEASLNRTATYTNLSPGNYTFRVLAANSDGVWNETGASFTFYLKPFIYQTWWFAVLCALGLIVIAYGVHMGRVHSLKAHQKELEKLVAVRTEGLRQEKNRTEAALLEAEAAQREAEQQREIAEHGRTVIEAQAEKLKDLDRLKTRFFNNISHDLRGPLTLTIGPLQKVLVEAADDLTAPLQNQLRSALRNAQRLLRLINELLYLSKIDSGVMDLHAQQWEIGGFVGGIVESFSAFADQRQLELAFVQASGNEEGVLYIDPEKLEKVFYNLLSNAVKFTPEKGRIRVALAERPAVNGEHQGWMDITVSDTGMGISAQSLPHIFDRFRQVEGAHSHVQEGTGLGLSIVKELVELHGGTVRVESEEGQGTTFTISLRLGSRHLRPEQLAENPIPPSVFYADRVEDSLADQLEDELPLQKEEALEWYQEEAVLEGAETVLVVDDDLQLRNYIRACLHPKYNTFEAKDGFQALKMAQNIRPDLIILDVMMPGMDGYETLERLRQEPASRDIPIIMLTALASIEKKVEGLKLGADDYLHKPFDEQELHARIRNLITLHRQEKELKVLNTRLEQKVQEQLDVILEERSRYEDELVSAKEKAEASDRLKTSILNNMSHEIRTPLTGILGFTEVLASKISEEDQEFVDYIKSNGRRLLELLSSILELSRLESDEMKFAPTPFDLVLFTREMVTSYLPLAQRKGLTLRVDYPEQALPVMLDREAADRILNNLLSNAIKFTEKGEVVVGVGLQDGKVILRVEDTGEGISEAFLPKIYEAFKQESEGLNRSYEGAGLGLTITQGFVRLMDGTIEVESRKGEGSTFTVHLPNTLSDAGSPGERTPIPGARNRTRQQDATRGPSFGMSAREES